MGKGKENLYFDSGEQHQTTPLPYRHRNCMGKGKENLYFDSGEQHQTTSLPYRHRNCMGNGMENWCFDGGNSWVKGCCFESDFIKKCLFNSL